MIKKMGAWAVPGLALAIALEVFGATTETRIGVCALYGIVAAPVAYRQLVAAMGRKRREQS